MAPSPPEPHEHHRLSQRQAKFIFHTIPSSAAQVSEEAALLLATPAPQQDRPHCCYCKPARLFLAAPPPSRAPFCCMLPSGPLKWAGLPAHPGCLPTPLICHLRKKSTQSLQLSPRNPGLSYASVGFRSKAIPSDRPSLTLLLTCFVPKGLVCVFTHSLPLPGPPAPGSGPLTLTGTLN